MTYAAWMEGWWPFIFILIAGALPTEIWRWLGIFLSKNIAEDSELLIFVRSVANALIAGLLTKLVLFPTGVLDAAPLGLRIGAALTGFAAFYFIRKSILIGILIGEIILLFGGYFLGIF
jgi:hypothetical protein